MAGCPRRLSHGLEGDSRHLHPARRSLRRSRRQKREATSYTPPYSQTIDAQCAALRRQHSGPLEENLQRRQRYPAADLLTIAPTARRRISPRFAIPSTSISCSAFDCRRGRRFPGASARASTRWTIRVVVSGLQFVPYHRTDYLATGFLQDEIGLVERRLSLTLGTKFLRTNFTNGVDAGAERAASLDAGRQANRLGGLYPRPAHSFRFRGEFLSLGLYRNHRRTGRRISRASIANPNFAPEQLNGYELGYRRLLGKNLYRRSHRILQPLSRSFQRGHHGRAVSRNRSRARRISCFRPSSATAFSATPREWKSLRNGDRRTSGGCADPIRFCI